MKAITREFMRGRLEALSALTQTARERFEEYLSEEDMAKRKDVRDRLNKVLRATRDQHQEVVESLEAALKEDGL